MNKLKTCKYCVYWSPSGNRENADIGECRRRAPSNLVEVKTGYRGWFNVFKNDWCGEFGNFHGNDE